MHSVIGTSDRPASIGLYPLTCCRKIVTKNVAAPRPP